MLLASIYIINSLFLHPIITPRRRKKKVATLANKAAQIYVQRKAIAIDSAGEKLVFLQRGKEWEFCAIKFPQHGTFHNGNTRRSMLHFSFTTTWQPFVIDREHKQRSSANMSMLGWRQKAGSCESFQFSFDIVIGRKKFQFHSPELLHKRRWRWCVWQR